MREKENYRLNLEQVYRKFGDLQLIPRREVAKWIGLDERTLAQEELGRKCGGRYYISAVELAKWLS